MMPNIMRICLRNAIHFAILVLCSSCLIIGCQTVPTKMNSGSLLQLAIAERDSAQCRDYAYQAVVNGREEIIRGKACPRSQ